MNATHNEIVIDDGEANRVTEATLFSDQAYVTREAGAEVGRGVQRLLVESHAFQIDPDSVQAKVYGQGELLGVQYKEVPVVEAPQEALRELDERLRAITRERRRIVDAREVVEKQRRFLDSTLEYAEVELPREVKSSFPSAAQMGEMIDFMDQRYASLAERGERLTVELEELDNEKLALERRRNKLHRVKGDTRRVIEILFDSASEQRLRIEAAYSAFQAGWLPFYKAEVAEDLSGLQLTQFARIRQATGEEWHGVKLAVSTAEPLRGAELPRAERWLLRRPLPQPALGIPDGEIMVGAVAAAAEPEMLDALGEDLEAGAAFEEPAAVAEATRKVLPSAFEYQLPLPVDIPSGDDDTLLTLTARQAEGAFYHHAVPRLDPRCYLVCETAADPELPPGPLNVHFAGRFVASTELGDQEAGVPLRFNLGADRSVRVKRETLTEKSAETFFGLVERTTAALELEYRLTVENLREHAIDVALFDTLPTSESDRYVVKGVELKPEPSDRDWEAREGVMRWRMALAPEVKKEVRIHLFVKYPRHERPEGL